MRYAILACMLLASCARTTTVTNTVTAATVGSDVLALASIVNLGSTYLQSQPNVSVKAVTDLNTAYAALEATGTSLRASSAQTGDVKSNIALVKAALDAAASGYATTSPAAATHVGEIEASLAVAIALYNADAAITGAPTI